MCYHSLSLRRGTFRNAKEGEDLVVATHEGHGIVRAQSDGVVACVRGGTVVQLAEFKLTPAAERSLCSTISAHPWLKEMIGKPVTAHFSEGSSYAADAIDVHSPLGITLRLHLTYFPQGLTLYTGPKRPEPVDIADTLGVTDPSIALDHNIEPSAAKVDDLVRA